MTSASLLPVDGHVHIHRCFPLGDFLRAAVEHFKAAAGLRHAPGGTVGCLMLSERAEADVFQQLRDGMPLPGGWEREETGEAGSLILECPTSERVLLLAGRQVVTAERIEVLALACHHIVPDGLELAVTLELVREADALPVLPWGFGKWWGERRRVIRRILADPDDRPLFLGDTGNRPRTATRPALLAVGEREGVIVLPGSDPLPLPWHVDRAGSYGFILDRWRADGRPAREMRRRLAALSTSPARFGTRASLVDALRSQLTLHWRRAVGSESAPERGAR